MNVYHIIYNSSEKSRDGSVGFGIRSASENTPQDILTDLKTANVFSIKALPSDISVTKLSQDHNLITTVPPYYFYNKVKRSNGKNLYVLGRKIQVGFDYTFYLNGKSGRLGNYVVDCYVFDDVPSADIFTLLYEQPSEGGIHFLPSSPVPAEDNEEMRRISVGSEPNLPVETFEFKTSHEGFDKRAVSVYLAYLEAKKSARPLMVKVDTKEAPSILADFYKLLPATELDRATFFTPHDTSGKIPGVNIVTIDDKYTFEIFPKQWYILDLYKGDKVDSAEARSFESMLCECADRGDLKTMRNIVSWLLSDSYNLVKDLSKETNEQIYNYIFDYDNFNYKSFLESPEQMKALAKVIASDKNQTDKLNRFVIECFETKSDVDYMVEMADMLLKLRANDINTDEILAAEKVRFNDIILSSPSSFIEFYKKTNKDIEKYACLIDKDQLLKHSDYLSEYTDDWDALYPYFIGTNVSDVDLIKRALRDDLSSAVLKRVVTKANISPKNQIDIFVDLVDSGEFDILAVKDYINKLLESRVRPTKVLLKTFNASANDSDYTDLFVNEFSLLDPQSEPSEYVRHIIGFLRSPLLKRYINSISINKACTAIKILGVKSSETTELANSLYNLYGQPHEVLDSIHAVVNHLEGTSPIDIANAQKAAIELGDNKYISNTFDRAIIYIPGSYLKDYVNYVLLHNIVSKDVLLNKVLRNPDYGYAWAAAIGKDVKWKGIKETLNTTGASDKQIDEFMEEFYPEQYAKYQKSLEPNVIVKLIGKLGFGKPKADKPQDSNNANDKRKDLPPTFRK